MRILLDECVPRRLERAFRPYGLVLTVTDAGLGGYTNGQLLRRIVGNVSFVLLDVPSNDITFIEPVLPRLFARWSELAPRKLLVVD